ncbi:MAG: type IV pilus assembly protein PilM [bacterium]
MTSVVGLDLGSNSIKGVEIESKRNKKILKSYSIGKSLPVSLNSSQVLDTTAIVEHLKEFYRESHFSTLSVNVTLSEEKVFTRVVTLPGMSPKEVGKAIKWEAQQYIPMEIEDVNFDYQIIEDTKDALKVLLVAAPKEAVTKIINIVKQAGLEPLGIETTIQALSHLRQLKESGGASLVLSFSSNTTDLGVIQAGLVRFTRSLPLGGDTLARSISEGLNIPLSQAEEYKKSYGLDDEKLEGKITKASAPILNMLVSEVRRSVDFYLSRGYGSGIERLFLSGGTANLPGITSYLAGKLGFEVVLVDPLSGLILSDKVKDEDLDNLGPSLALSVGLALGKYE